MPMKQEQEDARTEVTEVGRGVLRMELPISMPGLGHVNCYALLDDEGATIVDPGLPGNATWKALKARLAQADLEPRHVHTIIVTHSHPDHFGCASRFQREAGSKLIAHSRFGADWGHGHAHDHPEASVDDLTAQADAKRAAALERDPDADAKAAKKAMKSRWDQPAPWGGTPPRPPMKYRMRRRFAGLMNRDEFMPNVTDPVDHGDVLRLAGRDWFVHHTPGHTMDHFCLHDPEAGIFLSGDHVLPSITPHISGMTPDRDPLQCFFTALDQVAEIPDVKDVLPAHGHPFQELDGRAQAIKRHHRERLERIKEISAEIGGPGTVEAFSEKLFKPRSWGSMAQSETYAHLEHLRLLDEAECYRDEDGQLRYQTR